MYNERVTLDDGTEVSLHPIDFEELESLAEDLGDLAAIAGTVHDSLNRRPPEAPAGREHQVVHHLERRLEALSDELRGIAGRRRRIVAN